MGRNLRLLCDYRRALSGLIRPEICPKFSLRILERRAVHIHENVMAALMTLDTHAEAISAGIERLRD